MYVAQVACCMYVYFVSEVSRVCMYVLSVCRVFSVCMLPYSMYTYECCAMCMYVYFYHSHTDVVFFSWSTFSRSLSRNAFCILVHMYVYCAIMLRVFSVYVCIFYVYLRVLCHIQSATSAGFMYTLFGHHSVTYTLHILLPILYVAKECHYACSVYSRYVLNSGVCFVPF